MALSVVQHKPGHSVVSAVTVAVTISANSAGNLIVVGTGNHGTRTVTGVADDATGGSNTYVQATGALATANSSLDQIDVWYCLSAAHAGATTVTVTFSGSAGTFSKDAEVWEVSGFTTCAFDLAGANSNGNQTNHINNGPSITTTGATGFVVGVNLCSTADIVDINPNTGNEFTSGGDVGSNTAFAGCSLISSTAAAHQPVWHESNTFVNYCTNAAAFKETVATTKIPGFPSPTSGPSYAI